MTVSYVSPVLTRLNPSYALIHDGGTHQIMFEGTGLAPNVLRFSGATARVGGQPCNDLTWISSSQIRCNITSARLSAGTGSSASITVGGIASTLASALERIERPIVQSVDPADSASTDPSGAGTIVTISGSAFGQASSDISSVMIGSFACRSPQLVAGSGGSSLQSIRCTLGDGAGQNLRV